MDGEGRMEVIKSVGFCCEFVKKQKPFPCFYQGDGFQIGLRKSLVVPNYNRFECTFALSTFALLCS
jgi:hypothetical protein